MQSTARRLPVLSFIALVSLVLLFAFSAVQKAVAGGFPVLSSQYKKAPGASGEIGAATGQPQYAKLGDEAKIKRDENIKKRVTYRASQDDRRFRRKLSAKSAIVLDADTGTVLYEYNADTPRQPASTIKVITALLAIERLHDNDPVVPSHKAERMPRSKIYLKSGKRYKADDLINAVLLASANEASVALAEKIGGNESSFARMMTEKARRLGARSTICKTASGLTKSGQCSTARDLAVVFNGAMQNQEFAERMKHTRVKTSFGKILRNHNKALWRIAGAKGGKTGYTRAARQTYVGKFEKHGNGLIVAIMGSETMWDDISRLVRHGFARQKDLDRVAPVDIAESVQSRLAKLKYQLRYEHVNDLYTIKVLSENNKLSPQMSL